MMGESKHKTNGKQKNRFLYTKEAETASLTPPLSFYKRFMLIAIILISSFCSCI